MRESKVRRNVLQPAAQEQTRARGHLDDAEHLHARSRCLASPQRISLVSFMHYDLGYFDDETCRLEPIANPLGPRCCLCARHDLLPVQSEWTRYWPQIWTHVSLPIGHFARPSAKATIGSRACRFALARTPPDQRRRGYKVHPRTSPTARRHRHSRDLDLCPRVLLRMDFQIRAECSSNRARSLRAGRPLRVHRQPGMNEQAMAALASPPFYEARRLQLADDWGILCR